MDHPVRDSQHDDLNAVSWAALNLARGYVITEGARRWSVRGGPRGDRRRVQYLRAMMVLRNCEPPIARKQQRFTAWDMDPEKRIVVSAGATGVFVLCLPSSLIRATSHPFRTLLRYHINTLVATQSVPVYVRLSAPDWSFGTMIWIV